MLVRFGADFNAKDKDGRSALDLAKLLSNRQCYEIASGKKSPLPTPETPPSMRGKNHTGVHYTLYIMLISMFLHSCLLPEQ